MSEHKYTPLGPHAVFKVLGNNLRLHLFEHLCHEDLTIEDMQDITQDNYKTIYTQLKVLENNDLIDSYMVDKNRYYIAKESALSDLERWQQIYSDILKETHKS